MNCVVWDLFRTFLGPLGIFFPLGLFLGLRSGSNTFLEPTNVDYQFLFWKYSPIFLFSIWPNFGPFCNFLGPSGLFLGLGFRLKNFFGTCLHRLTTFILEVQLYLASLKLYQVGGQVVGWVVGNFDFNENPVVSLDLDLDLWFVKNAARVPAYNYSFATKVSEINLFNVVWVPK